jgi:hypothetical protein
MVQNIKMLIVNNWKELASMALVMKPGEATVIKSDMLKDFLNELCENRISKEYWNECMESRNLFSDSEVKKMKQMINGE